MTLTNQINLYIKYFEKVLRNISSNFYQKCLNVLKIQSNFKKKKKEKRRKIGWWHKREKEEKGRRVKKARKKN